MGQGSTEMTNDHDDHRQNYCSNYQDDLMNRCLRASSCHPTGPSQPNATNVPNSSGARRRLLFVSDQEIKVVCFLHLNHVQGERGAQAR